MYAEFGAYIRQERNAQQLSRERLSEGICAPITLTKIETEERFADKLLRDRLLERLGIDEYGFESFLPNKEYARWKKREQILQALENNRLEDAQIKIIEYGLDIKPENCIEKQIYLCMQIQYQKKTKTNTNIILALIKEALLLTVPSFEQLPLSSLLLSYKELDLYLEYVFYSPTGNTLENYCNILEYIENSLWDSTTKAKLYPKCCLYLYKHILRTHKQQVLSHDIATEMLALCNYSIQLLQNSCRMYYLWELLCLRESLLTNFLVSDHAIQKLLQETIAWKEALLAICRLAYPNINSEEAECILCTKDSCYLYREKEVYSFSEVLIKRKKMLNLTWSKLCSGICSEKTLKRMRNERTSPHPYIIRKLLMQIGLQAEYQRTDLVSESRKTKKAAKKLRTCLNEQDLIQAEALLDLLKSELSPVPVNQQFLLLTEAIIDEYKGVPPEKYLEKMKQALCCTLPYSTIETPGEKHFTGLELQCIYNIFINLTKKEEQEKFVQMLLNIFQEYDKNGTAECYVGQYELILKQLASVWGNWGDYSKSTELEKKIIQLCFRCHRINMLYNNMYAIMWNNSKCAVQNNTITFQQQQQYLQHCIALSQLAQDPFYENIFRKKLYDLQTYL